MASASEVKVSAVNGQPVLVVGDDLVELTADQAENIGFTLIDAGHNYRRLLAEQASGGRGS